MLLRTFLPSPSLSAHVRSIGVVHFEFTESAAIAPKVYAPRPETSLYFFPRDPEYIAYQGMEKVKRPSVCLYGQHTIMNHRFVGRNFLALIVHFQPGVIHRLTGLPMHELKNTIVAADLVLPPEISHVNEQLNNCTSYSQMLAVIETFLTKAMRRVRGESDGVDAAARFLLQKGGNISVECLAKETSLSCRQFERKFKDRTGVTPSILARLSRFTKSIRAKSAQPYLDLLSIAVKCGYHDYQHMTRDFREFTGMTPATFFYIDARAPERAPGLSEGDKIYAATMSDSYH